MKRFFHIFASLLILGGCVDRLNVAGEQQVPDGEMAVNLRLDGPMAGPGTRSYVNGTETAIQNPIKMLCFDGQGAYLTSRDGEVHPTDDTHGTLTGQVPANTCRIHFVANFEGLDLSSFGMGSLERVMMKSEKLASGINDPVRFWGYHKENSPAEMAGYLNGGNTLILLRDRAKVNVINQDSDIESIQWTISNGLNKGFVATASAADNANPFDNNYATSTILTEYRSSGVYTFTSEPADTDKAWASAGTGDVNAQFLFENSNSTAPVKIIVKAKFKNGKGTRYHTILLQDADKKLFRVYRNQSFTLTIKDLPDAGTTTAIGSDNFIDAVNTENYSNNPFAQVEREVNEINDEVYRLTVEKVAYIYNSGTTATIPFTYTKLDGTAVSYDASAFDVTWEPKGDDDERPDVSPVTTNPTVTYSGSTGKGTITFPLSQITSELKFNTLQIVSPSGLTRYVDVYSITQFSFQVAPALVDNNTKRTVNGIQRETYKLTFTLPNNLPDAVFPMTVRMYTSTLVPFSDSGATAPHGSFNVAVGKTNFLDATDQPAQWNFNANKWDSWYEFVINEPSSSGAYTIYLNEFVAEHFPAQTLSTVGLYFEIDGFGGRRPLSAAAPQPSEKSVSFVPSDFDFGWFGDDDTHTINGITISLDRFDKSDGYLVAGYRSWGTNYAGTIQATCGSGAPPISRIVITYRSGYLGGQVSCTSGNFAKSGTTGTWTGSTDDVTLTLYAGSGNSFAQISKIDVMYLSY